MALGVCYYPEHWPEQWWRYDARRMREVLYRKDIGADVAVHADELHGLGFLGAIDGGVCTAVAQVETELGIVLAGGDVFVRVHGDAGRDAQLHARCGQTGDD